MSPHIGSHYIRHNVETGQGLVEYALILVLVSVVSIVVLAFLGEQVQTVFCDVLLSLGENAPEIAACEAPRVTCDGVADGSSVSSPLFMEAIVNENKGPENIKQVDFYIDGNHIRTEFQYRYCLGGTDNCSNGQYVPSGNHTIRAVARDKDGYEGTCEVTVSVN